LRDTPDGGGVLFSGEELLGDARVLVGEHGHSHERAQQRHEGKLVAARAAANFSW